MRDALVAYFDLIGASGAPAAVGALALADRLDANLDGAAGAAAALRQIREVMADLSANGPREADVVDYIEMCHDARRAGYLHDLDLDAITEIIRIRDTRVAARRAAYLAVPVSADG